MLCKGPLHRHQTPERHGLSRVFPQPVNLPRLARRSPDRGPSDSPGFAVPEHLNPQRPSRDHSLHGRVAPRINLSSVRRPRTFQQYPPAPAVRGCTAARQESDPLQSCDRLGGHLRSRHSAYRVVRRSAQTCAASRMRARSHACEADAPSRRLHTIETSNPGPSNGNGRTGFSLPVLPNM
jgi:hypothetical protein